VIQSLETTIARPATNIRSGCAVASPGRTKSTRVSIVKPCASFAGGKQLKQSVLIIGHREKAPPRLAYGGASGGKP
jgi:hypothetical protein